MTSLLLSVQIVFGQDFSKDIAELNYSYLKLNRKMTVNSSIVKFDGTTSSTSMVTYMRGIDDFYMIGGSSEILVQNSIKVAVNHDLKIVMIDSNKKDSKEDLPMSMFEALPQFYAQIKHRTNSQGDTYYLEPKVGNTKSIELSFSRQTMLFSKVSVTVFDNRTQQNYTATNIYSYTPINAGDIPPINKYFNVTTHKLQGKFASYKLVNYLEN